MSDHESSCLKAYEKGAFLRTNNQLILNLGIIEASVMSYLLSGYTYHKKEKLLTEDGFFFVKSSQMIKRLGISEYQRKKSVGILKQLDLIRTECRDKPPKLYYQINFKILLEFFSPLNEPLNLKHIKQKAGFVRYHDSANSATVSELQFCDGQRITESPDNANSATVNELSEGNINSATDHKTTQNSGLSLPTNRQFCDGQRIEETAESPETANSATVTVQFCDGQRIKPNNNVRARLLDKSFNLIKRSKEKKIYKRKEIPHGSKPYGEFQHVFLTDKEYAGLIKYFQYGEQEAQFWIMKVDRWLEDDRPEKRIGGKKAIKSFYRQIQNFWHRDPEGFYRIAKAQKKNLQTHHNINGNLAQALQFVQESQ